NEINKEIKGGKLMNKSIKRVGIGLGLVAIILGSSISFSEPGSVKDPLATMSYVDKKIEQIMNYIDDKIANDQVNQELNGFVVVELEKDKTLILGAGSELILRSGEAKAISQVENGTDNGLADVTAGIDTKMDELIKLNHLLLTPRDDGRGARAT